jgi:SulP family sulfate permease
LAGDVIAGAIVTVMLIPQSLAYAMLAGLPPQAGLYASLLPIFAYALFGSSMTLAVGPVAVASLMTATALAPLASVGSVDYAALAVILALLSGVMLFVFGLLRLGFLAYFLSHPVISGFISGSAVVIAIGQLKYIFGIQIPRGGIITTLSGLVQGLPTLHVTTTLLGCGALLFLFFVV